MHPRNLFLIHPPSFSELSDHDDGFRRHCKPPKYIVDWSNANALRTLSRAILSYYIGIHDWSCPKERLCPAIPNRLNYVLTCQDLLASFVLGGPETDIGDVAQPLGLDVGTGASAVYSLLGSKLANFRFFGTDIDELSMKSAFTNVVNAKLLHKIDLIFTGTEFADMPPGTNVHHVPCDTLLLNPMAYALSKLQGDAGTVANLQSASNQEGNRIRDAKSFSKEQVAWPIEQGQPATTNLSFIKINNRKYKMISNLLQSCGKFAFVMCNPPFFRTWEEAVESMSEAERSAGTGTITELVYDGGEVNFVSRMIMESALMEGRLYKRGHEGHGATISTEQFYCHLENQLHGTWSNHADTATGDNEVCQNPGCLRLNDEKIRSRAKLPPTSKTVSSLWYTSMVGKQSSLNPLIEVAMRASAPTIRVYPLVQGVTMRWVLAWSFLPPMSFLSPEWRYLESSNIPDQQLLLHCAMLKTSAGVDVSLPECGCNEQTSDTNESHARDSTEGSLNVGEKRNRELTDTGQVPQTLHDKSKGSQERDIDSLGKCATGEGGGHTRRKKEPQVPIESERKGKRKKTKKSGSLFSKYMNRKPVLQAFVVDNAILTNLRRDMDMHASQGLVGNNGSAGSTNSIEMHDTVSAPFAKAWCGSQNLFVAPSDSDTLALAEVLMDAKHKVHNTFREYQDKDQGHVDGREKQMNGLGDVAVLSYAIEECLRREHMFHKSDKQLKFHVLPKRVRTVNLSPWFHLERCPNKKNKTNGLDEDNGSKEDGMHGVTNADSDVESVRTWRVICTRPVEGHRFLNEIPLFEMELQVLKVLPSSSTPSGTQASQNLEAPTQEVSAPKEVDQPALEKTSPRLVKYAAPDANSIDGPGCTYVVVSLLLKSDPADNAAFQCWERTSDRLRKYIHRSSRFFRRRTAHLNTNANDKE